MPEGETASAPEAEAGVSFQLVAKWNGAKFDFRLPGSSTVGQVRCFLQEQTRVPQKRQKLIGLGKKPNPDDSVALDDLQLKNPHSFMMVGAPDEAMMLEVSQIDDLPEIINDLDQDFSYDSKEQLEFIANAENQEKLKKCIRTAEINTMNPPRTGKHLLVLDLDHTLLHLKDRFAHKRPHCIEFLRALYPYYDLCVWSQTKWIYIEQKLQDIGILGLSDTNPDFNITFILDRTAMFKIKSHRMTKDGKPVEHEVKPLELIWQKFPDHYNSKNTVHIDDLSRNFAMNPDQGLKITKFDVDQSRIEDGDLVPLERYLLHIAQNTPDFSTLKHSAWKDTLKDIPR